MSLPRRLTFIDLMVLLLVLVPVAAAFVAFAFRPVRGDPSGRVRCASNLRQIGQAIQMYANANKGAFPRAVFDGAGGPPTEFTGALAQNPFGADGPGPNDITAAMFLLLRTQDLTSDVFLCPSPSSGTAWDFGGRKVTEVSNFPSRQYLQYAYTNPYPTLDAEARGFKLNFTLTSDFAIAADMSPGDAAVAKATPTSPRQVMLQANSANHNGDGQYVLYADGHVEFQNTPFCGMLRTSTTGGTNAFRDNIYTSGSGSSGGGRGSPVDALDSVLLPTGIDGPAPGVATSPRTLLLRAIVAAAVVGFLLIVLLRLRRKPACTPPSIQ